jgi:hypothetical protein
MRLIASVLGWLAIAAGAHAEIVVDGKLDEPEWKAGSLRCSDWRLTEPFSRSAPRYKNDLRIVSLPNGLAAAFVIDQPADERRIKPRTPRDTDRLSSDHVQLIVDFDANGQVGYEFTVSLSGSVRDGLLTNQVEFDRDWDGEWSSAVRETDNQWIVEVLIPWTSISMQATTAPKRHIAVYASRFLFNRSERYACPGVVARQGTFLSDFKRLEIDQYSARPVVDVVPYVTALSDFVDDSLQVKAGADLAWKPSDRLRIAAAINPDFGQIESDELVVDFSAIETVQTDKRPFFTENQGQFDVRTPRNGQVIYTRRIGAARDDGTAGTTDIDAAAKLTGNTRGLTYGAIAAQEDGYGSGVGRFFSAARLSAPLSWGRLGYIGTWTDRPYRQRTALVNALDFELAPDRAWRVAGQALRSDIEVAGDSTPGYSGWIQADLNRTGLLSHTAKLLYIDDKFSMNDLGYMERNRLRRAEWNSNRSVTYAADHRRVAGETQRLTLTYQENDQGDRLASSVDAIRDIQYRNAWRGYQRVRYLPSNVDDLISRNNGPVRIDDRIGAYMDITSPRIGDWRYVTGFNFFQQGVNGYSGHIELNATWYAHEQLTLRMIVLPSLSEDWLVWQRGNSFGSFRSQRLDLDFRLDWLPAPRHEVRVRWQWIGLQAEPNAAYRNLPSGELVRTDAQIAAFSVSNLALQIRYRFELGPQSDLYLVYARGGLERDTSDPDEVDSLFGRMWDLRNSDQALVKFRYRL